MASQQYSKNLRQGHERLLKEMTYDEVMDLAVQFEDPNNQPTPLLNPILNDFFDKNILLKLDRTPSAQVGRVYADPQTEACRIGFIHAHKMALKAIVGIQVNNRRENHFYGPFVIGRETSRGGIQFGGNPNIHRNPANAKREALRLAKIYGGEFTVFGAMEKIREHKNPTNPQPLKDTPKRTPTPTQTMKRLQEIVAKIRESEIEVEGSFPIGVTMEIGNTFSVMFSNGEPSPIAHVLFEEAVAEIAQWIESINK